MSQVPPRSASPNPLESYPWYRGEIDRRATESALERDKIVSTLNCTCFVFVSCVSVYVHLSVCLCMFVYVGLFIRACVLAMMYNLPQSLCVHRMVVLLYEILQKQMRRS